ncbi:peptidyl-prolyl cis-trans isomerase FKBP8 [Anabrus simplex]|uniref:peptidyl-prolyl cis-trans isomerase FKBP8 n=1 Tax=Anabrus simplex TaxID=316456 RepID=UPI0035A2A0C6
MQSTVDTPSLENSSSQKYTISENSNDSGVHENLEQPNHSSKNEKNHSEGNLLNHKQDTSEENHANKCNETAENIGSGDSKIINITNKDVLTNKDDVNDASENKEDANESGITDKDTISQEGTSEKESKQDLSNKVDDTTTEEEWLDILGSGQLRKKVLTKAENSYRPQNMQLCEVNIEGWLEDGTVVEKYTNFKFQLGDMEVVQGLDLGLPLMDVGEEALIEVGPRFAYGNIGRGSDIPPNATIIYKVELLSAEHEPDLDTLTAAERSRIGNKKRERGNWWYERENYTAAIQCYRRAVEYLDELDAGIEMGAETKKEENAEDERSLLEDRLKVFNNLAAAQMKIKSFDTALESVEKVLICQPENVKALFRKGKILAAKGETPVAITVLRQASQLEPESKTIKQELLRLLNQNKRETKMEKNLYKRMLGQDKSAETSSSKTSKFYQMRWGVVFGSIAAMVAGVVAYRYKFL